MSRKPNPAVLADGCLASGHRAADLVDFLDRARGCHVEIILKDISTVRYDPRRLWEWERIAMEVVQA